MWLCLFFASSRHNACLRAVLALTGVFYWKLHQWSKTHPRKLLQPSSDGNNWFWRHEGEFVHGISLCQVLGQSYSLPAPSFSVLVHSCHHTLIPQTHCGRFLPLSWVSLPPVALVLSKPVGLKDSTFRSWFPTTYTLLRNPLWSPWCEIAPNLGLGFQALCKFAPATILSWRLPCHSSTWVFSSLPGLIPSLTHSLLVHAPSVGDLC